MVIIKNELIEYRELFEKELLSDILPFWMNHCVDERNDSFYGAVDLKGNPDPDVALSCVLNARILWTFSAAAIRYQKPEYASMAHRAYKILVSRFEDKIHGGCFMEVSPDGEPSISIKHTYVQAFVIYAVAEYFRLTRLDEVIERARGFYTLLEEHAKDPVHKGYLEAFTRDWNLYQENRMADNNEPKSMNTHLHMLEAYTALYKVWKDPGLRNRLKELVDLFLTCIIRPDCHLGLFFELDFSESVSGVGICSFGHEIEGSWLLHEAAEVLADESILEKVRKVSVGLVDAVKKCGFDHDGGLFLESYRNGSHIRTNKHWWIQAENLVGFMNAFCLTGDYNYWDCVKKSWTFIDDHVIDHENGEWFAKVNRSGKPYLEEPADDPSPYYLNNRKIDPWKCPYHNGRAMLELIERIDKIVIQGKDTDLAEI